MPATDKQIRDLAGTIAAQAQAIADGTLAGPVYAQARGILANAGTLAAWVPDDRSEMPAAKPADPLIPHEDGTLHDGSDDEPWDEHASSLLPTGETMNPAHPEGASYYDRDLVAYIVTGAGADNAGAVRVLTSSGRLNGWNLNTLHAIRHDQSCRDLGRYRVTGIRNYKTGFQAGEIPDRPVRQWVFK